jgi:PAS domain S-box-containing protein
MVNVLLVDDEQELLEIASEFLENIGEIEVDVSLGADDALEKLKETRYDVIVSDYQMPGSNGITFLKKLRERNDHTPFILFTGKGREEVVIEAINNGADHYLQKGGDPRAQFTELVHQINSAVRGTQAESDLRRRTEELDNFFNLGLDLMVIADIDGYFKVVNSRWERVVGYNAEELTAHPFMDFVHPEDAEATKAAMSVLASQGEVQNLVNRYRAKDGSYRYLEWMSHPVGKRIYAVARDVTDAKMDEIKQKHLSEVLRAIRNVNQMLVKERNREKLLDGICSNLAANRGFSMVWVAAFNKDGSFNSLHGSGSRMSTNGFRCSFESNVLPVCIRKAMEKNTLVISDVTSNDCTERQRCGIQDGETSLCIPIKLRARAYGAILVLLPSNVPVTSEEISLLEEIAGDIAFGLGSIDNEEAMEVARKSLVESQALFSSIFHRSPVPMAITRQSDGLFIELNDSFLEIMHYDRQGTIGKTTQELRAWAIPGERRMLIDELTRNGFVRQRRIAVRTGDERLMKVELSMIPVTYRGEKCLLSTFLKEPEEMESHQLH